MFASAHEVSSDKGVDMPVDLLDRQFGPDSSETCGGSTGPVLGQVGCASRRATTGAWFDGAENCGCPAVAVHRRSST